MRTKCKNRGRRNVEPKPAAKECLNPGILEPVSIGEAVLSSSTGSVVDSLRFKLVSRDGKHFFTDVRLGGSLLCDKDKLAILALLNDECLENLSSTHVSSMLGRSRHIREVQDMIAELQSVLCG